MKATLVHTNDFGFVVFSKINLIEMERITNGVPSDYMFSDKMKIICKPKGCRKLKSKTFRFRTPSNPSISEQYIILKGWVENPVEQYDGSVTCFSQDIFQLVQDNNLTHLIIADSNTKNCIGV